MNCSNLSNEYSVCARLCAGLVAWLIGQTACIQAVAQVPGLLNFQGRLIDGTNLVQQSGMPLEVRLYNQISDGVCVYAETQTVDVVDGLYSFHIGAEAPAPDALETALTNDPVYLELEVDGTVLSPRERLTAAAYALWAGGVETGAIRTGMLASNVVTGDKIAFDAVTGAHIADGTIEEIDLSDAALSDRWYRKRGVWRVEKGNINYFGDDGVAVGNAITDAPAGAEVYIGPGVYTNHSIGGLQVPAGVIVKGSGKPMLDTNTWSLTGGTILEMDRLTCGYPQAKVGNLGLNIIGGGNGFQAGSTAQDEAYLYVENVSVLMPSQANHAIIAHGKNIHLRNVTTYRGVWGIVVKGSESTIIDCHVDCASAGLYIGGQDDDPANQYPAYNNQIVGCHFREYGGYEAKGISIGVITGAPHKNLLISRCIAHEGVDSLVRVNSPWFDWNNTNSGLWGVSIEGCAAYKTTYGISIAQGGNMISISDFLVVGALARGVYINSSTNIMINNVTGIDCPNPTVFVSNSGPGHVLCNNYDGYANYRRIGLLGDDGSRGPAGWFCWDGSRVTWRVSGINYDIWTENQDGPGSGLDADLLDGLDSSSLVRSDQGNNWNHTQSFNNNVIISNTALGTIIEIDNDTGIATLQNGLKWDLTSVYTNYLTFYNSDMTATGGVPILWQ